MELCDTTLHSYLLQRNEVDPKEMFRLFDQAVQGVAFLHSNRIVHRDLKPGNLMLHLTSKQLKIGDFGLATLLTEDSEYGRLGKVGTPMYMAPELSQSMSLNS